MKAKPTEGPWVASEGWPSDVWHVDMPGRRFSVVVSRSDEDHDMPVEEVAANAILIAAAPELLAIAKGLVGMLENCGVESGVCCCGDDMARHASPMDCGHSPVDSGAYYADSLLKDAYAAIAKVTGEQP